jgi:maleate isomerase
MQSLPAIQPAQEQLGIPITSTSVCTARNMLDLLSLDARVPGFGRLLEIA